MSENTHSLSREYLYLIKGLAYQPKIMGKLMSYFNQNLS
ncbi:hypothetical protein AHMF7616_04680 [Adhaeribacter pallidiroseus]|uniref:Uncharacterized protein n=1 Tax=Adhaeribacter pallidiroseus TaxID=2072847 RepID=A0A369QT96_9BACT|nr:hypothetical protein AHMF7616_04680 [Adhaeribacter pallidiroseus]